MKRAISAIGFILLLAAPVLAEERRAVCSLPASLGFWVPLPMLRSLPALKDASTVVVDALYGDNLLRQGIEGMRPEQVLAAIRDEPIPAAVDVTIRARVDGNGPLPLLRFSLSSYTARFKVGGRPSVPVIFAVADRNVDNVRIAAGPPLYVRMYAPPHP